MNTKFKHYSFTISFFLPTLLIFNNSFESKFEENRVSSIKMMVEICDNGIDDDGDELVDCFDNDCFNSILCEDFYFGGAAEPCTFIPPVVPQFELEKIFCTDFENFPIEQRSSAYVGDMDGDGIPEIVGNDPNPPRIQIFSGVDGTIKQSIVVEGNHPFSQLAIADVDRNGLGDIFRNENGNNLARYEYGNPNPVWKTADGDGDNTTYSDPQVADFDGDGDPEVYLGSRVFNSLTGTRLAVGTQNQGIHKSGDRYTLAYDIFKPGDPKPGGGTFGAEAAGLELLAGNQVYTVELGNGTMDNGALTVVSEVTGTNVGDGFVSIGDLDNDGEIDLIIMDGGKVYAWNPRTETLIGTVFDIPNTTAGGRINVGDFDNDGLIEMGMAGKNIYMVLEYDSGSNTLVEKWRKTGLDDGSERTGSTLFDFEGDGSNEVVYSEEGFLYVLEGATGSELAKIPSEAGTRTEYPLVADVNGDGVAEVIVTAQNGNGPGFSGNDFVCVYRSKASPWVSARPVWNQHGYFNTNINDDLTVPLVQQDILNPAFNNAFNGFLVQSTILSAGSTPAFAASDATLELLNIGIGACPDLDIQMKVKNIGSADFPAGTPIAFYDGDPTAGTPTLLGTTTLVTTVLEGDSTTFNYTLGISPLITPIDVYAVVNDTGFVAANLPYDFNTDFPVTGTPECDFSNNLHKLTSSICVEICGDGLDNDTDGLIDEPNIISTQITGCSGTGLPQMTVDVAGVTWTAISSIGTTVDGSGNVTLGTNLSATPDIDTIVYYSNPCRDTVFVSTFDAVAPILSCPGDRTLAVNASCTATLVDYLSEVSTSDNCSATANITLVQSPVSGTVIGLGLTTITITATDESGNISNCNFKITGTDFINPTIACPTDILVQVDNSCNFLVADYTGGATVSDNCSSVGNINISQNPGGGTILNGHATTQTVVLTAFDESNNTTQCTFEIELEDNIDPTVSCPANQVLQSNTSCEALLPDFTALATCADNCTPKSSITFIQTPAPGTTISSIGSSAVLIAVFDGNGNNADCSFQITLEDNLDPEISCPLNKNIDVDGSCNFILADYTSQATISDNCTADGAITVTQSPPFATVVSGHGTTQIVTLTADDGKNNTQNCTFTITLDDPTQPTITCPTNTNVNANANCEIAISDYTSSATVADNCSAPANISITQSPPVGTTISGHGTAQNISLTAKDEAGNTEFCIFQITINDNIAPSITCPDDQNVNVSGGCSINLRDYTSSSTPTDNCSASANISVIQSPPVGNTLTGDGTMQLVTLTANDEAANSVQCTFTVTLVNNTIPAITCPANSDVAVNNACNLNLPDFTDEAVVVGVCDPSSAFTVTQSPASGTLFSGVGMIHVVVLTADDMNGQMNSCSFQITLSDESNPSITCPTNTGVALDANCEISLADYTGATVSDNCTASGAIIVTQSPIAGATLSGAGSLENITLTADDGNGNTTQCDFFLSLNDNTPPTINCPINQVEPTNGSCEVKVPSYVSSATVADNCTMSGAITVTQSPPADSILLGSGIMQTVTLTAEDGSQNQQTCTFLLTTGDDTPPEITCPVNQDLELDASCQRLLPDYTVASVFSDNCAPPGNVTVSQSPVVGSVILDASTIQIVTLTADDGNGNTTDCMFTLTATDITNPSLTCPVNQNVSLDASCQIAFPDFSSSTTFSDNCTAMGSIILTQNPTATTVFTDAESVVLVTITADDSNGNSVSCNFNVTIDDDTNPTVTCPSNQNVYPDANCEYRIPNYTDSLAASDNCAASAEILITQMPPVDSILTGHNVMQAVFVIADDGNGNMSQCDFLITVVDTLDPVIICPADLEVPLTANCNISLADYTGAASVSDNCTLPGNITLTQNPIATTTLATADFMQNITLTANDGNGNTAQCIFKITLKDVTAPSTTCPDNQTLIPDAACDILLPDFSGMLTMADNCSANIDIIITQSPAATTVFSGNGTNQSVTLTATDESDNATDCSFNFTIADNTPPSITCPADMIINPDANCEFTVPSYFSSATYSDNCTSAGAIGLSQVVQSGTVIFGDETVETITLTADDGNGNSASCYFDITLDDKTPPSITCPVPQTIGVDDVCSVPLPDYTSSGGVTDNCGKPADFTISQLPLAGTNYSGDGTVISVTLTANDGNGNSTVCSFDVTLVDMAAPALTCPGNQENFADGTCMVSIPDFTAEAAVTNQCMMGSGITLSQLPIAGTVISGHGTIETITITADDGSGNMTPCSFDLTVRDTTPPALVCPNNYTEQADDNCQFEVLNYIDSVTVSDNCTAFANLTMSQSPLENSLLIGFGIPHTIEVTAEDEVGNISMCDFTVTLEDNLPPYIGCPDDQQIELELNCTGLVPNFTPEAIKTDNCNSPASLTITQSPLPGTPLVGHSTAQPITLTANDGSGGVTSCTFELTFVDIIKPEITCPGDLLVEVDATCDFALPDYTGDASATDNCTSSGGIAITQSPAISATVSGHETTQIITLTADDGNGNTEECTFEITLEDNIVPIVSCPADAVLSVDANCEIILPNYTSAATISDNCTSNLDIISSQLPAPGTVYSGHGFSETITLNFNDGNGNSSQCEFMIRLDDDTNPVVNCPANTSIFLDETCEINLPDYTSAATVSDNCTDLSALTMTQSPTASTLFSGKPDTITVTLTVDDGNGNSANCDFEVRILDVTNPVISCPADYAIDLTGDCEYLLPDLRASFIGQNECSADTDLAITQIPIAGTILPGTQQVHVITFTAVDNSGNSTDCNFQLRLNDKVAPQFTCPVNRIIRGNGCEYEMPDFGASLILTDNCDAAEDIILTQTPAPTLNFVNGTHAVTLEATDTQGNSTQCNFEIRVAFQQPCAPVGIKFN